MRLTAIFQSFDDTDRIGPLRSARSYHPGIVAEYDGIFFHHGHSDLALPYLDDERCDDLEGIANSGWPAVFESSDPFRRSQYLYQSGEGDEAGGEAWFPHGDEAGLHL